MIDEEIESGYILKEELKVFVFWMWHQERCHGWHVIFLWTTGKLPWTQMRKPIRGTDFKKRLSGHETSQ